MLLGVAGCSFFPRPSDHQLKDEQQILTSTKNNRRPIRQRGEKHVNPEKREGDIKTDESVQTRSGRHKLPTVERTGLSFFTFIRISTDSTTTAVARSHEKEKKAILVMRWRRKGGLVQPKVAEHGKPHSECPTNEQLPNSSRATQKPSGMRATRAIREGLKNEPFKTHVADRSALWKTIREKLVVNPESNTGSPLVVEHRWPTPASRPEKMSVPASKASDVAENPYWKRDFRRMYPTTAVVTQDELAKLLIAQGGFTALPAPSTASSSSTALTADSPSPSLSSLFLTTTTGSSETANAYKPPLPPTKKLIWKLNKDAIPHNPQSYFPMVGYDLAK